MRSKPRPLDLVLAGVILSCCLSGVRWQRAGSRDLSPVGEERRADVCPIGRSFDHIVLLTDLVQQSDGWRDIDANRKKQILG